MECTGLGSRLRDIESALESGGGTPTDPCKQEFKFDISTSSTVFTLAQSITIPDNQVALIEFEATSRDSNGINRASFKRVGLFFRQSASAVQIERTWHTIITIKNDPKFDVDFQLTANAVQFRVRSASSSSTHWKGCANVLFVD